MAAEAHERPDPADERRLKAAIENAKRSIDFTLRSPGESQAEQADSMRVVHERRMEKAKLEAELRALQELGKAKPSIPSIKKVQAVLKELATHLINAAQSSDPDERASIGCW